MADASAVRVTASQAVWKDLKQELDTSVWVILAFILICGLDAITR
jgi:hypothetical protein